MQHFYASSCPSFDATEALGPLTTCPRGVSFMKNENTMAAPASARANHMAMCIASSYDARTITRVAEGRVSM